MTAQTLTWRDLLGACFVLASLWLLGLAGVPQWLGAHPFWAMDAARFGGILGCLGYLGLRLVGVPPRALLSLALVGLVASIASAVIGKCVFAASFAEDAIAGRFWFFGWFGVCACVALIGCVIVRRGLRR